VRLVYTLIVIAVLISCERIDPGPVITDQVYEEVSGNGFFIINEGNFTRGNGSLSFFSIDSSKIYNNLFLRANNRGPGDIPFSMCVMGDTGYLVVNNSGKIEMIDMKTAKSIRTLTDMISPRYFEIISNGKAYVSSLYSDSIVIIDLVGFNVTGYIDIGRNSEMMKLAGNKCFIASWSGDKKITVIDVRNDIIMTTITVVSEPESMVIDKHGRLWVLCSGGYMKDETAALICIDTATNEIISETAFPQQAYPTSLTIDPNGETIYFVNNGIYRKSVNDSEIPPTPFVPANGRLFYRVGPILQNGDIFVTDANDYQRKGFLLKYDSNGILKQTWEAGIIPGHMMINEVK
jgi:DNA-binding beta-propeller fold protein YncE